MKLNTGLIAVTPEAFPHPEKAAALKNLTDTVNLHFLKNSDWRDEIETFRKECLELNCSADEISKAFMKGLPAKY